MFKVEFWICMHASLVIQSCLTLCESMVCSPPGSSAHGFLQARILEWVPIPFCPTQRLNLGLLNFRQLLYLPRANESVFTVSLTSFHIFPQPHLGFSGLPWLIPPNDLFSAARQNFPHWAHYFLIQKTIDSIVQTITQKLWFSWHVGCPTIGPLLFLPVFPSTLLPFIAQGLVQLITHL